MSELSTRSRVDDSPVALKETDGKVDLSYIPWDFVEELCRVYMFGAEKYDRDNWKKGHRYSVALASLQRHLFAWAKGENTNEESGRSHLVHATFWLAALFYWQRTGKGKDDRL